jgi:hypothetical protein
MIIRVGYDDVACTVKRDAAGCFELTSAWASAAASCLAYRVESLKSKNPEAWEFSLMQQNVKRSLI